MKRYKVNFKDHLNPIQQPEMIQIIKIKSHATNLPNPKDVPSQKPTTYGKSGA